MKSYKYDKTEQKIFLIVGCILSVAFVIALVVVALEDRSGNVDTAGVIATLVLFFTPLPALACWYSYIDSFMYFKRLAKHGIEVPLHKKDQPFIVETASSAAELPMERYSRESTILAVITYMVSAGILIWFITYAVRFCMVGCGDAVLFMGFWVMVLVALWIVGAGVYRRQRSNEKYKDEGDPDPMRKARTSIFKGILTILICLMVTVMICRTVESMTDYNYRTKLEVKFGDSWRDHYGEHL